MTAGWLKLDGAIATRRYGGGYDALIRLSFTEIELAEQRMSWQRIEDRLNGLPEFVANTVNKAFHYTKWDEPPQPVEYEANDVC